MPDERIAAIFGKARRLYGKHIVHVNSTYHGGGVAAILESLIEELCDSDEPDPADIITQGFAIRVDSL